MPSRQKRMNSAHGKLLYTFGIKTTVNPKHRYPLLSKNTEEIYEDKRIPEQVHLYLLNVYEI